jgi:site-specific DNA-methyltransferase (adenine-specific)
MRIGGGGTGTGSGRGSTGTSIHFQRKNVRKPDGTWGYANWRNMGEEIRKKIIAWDIAPGKEYFEELFRVSRNQIIWGGNYFELPPTRCFLIWRKLTISESFSMAMAEYAWTSFNQNAKVFECVPQDSTGTRFHPTQKPVRLYEWVLDKFAKPGDIILDTHAGSASSLVACHKTGHKYVGFEIDKQYYAKAKKRLEAEESQSTIFDFLRE